MKDSLTQSEALAGFDEFTDDLATQIGGLVELEDARPLLHSWNIADFYINGACDLVVTTICMESDVKANLVLTYRSLPPLVPERLGNADPSRSRADRDTLQRVDLGTSNIGQFKTADSYIGRCNES